MHDNANGILLTRKKDIGTTQETAHNSIYHVRVIPGNRTLRTRDNRLEFGVGLLGVVSHDLRKVVYNTRATKLMAAAGNESFIANWFLTHPADSCINP
jgi:hypothetical protein